MRLLRNRRSFRPDFSRALRRSLVGAILIASLAATACAPASIGEPPSASAVALPGSAVGTEAAWVLSVLNAPDPVAEARVTRHLAQIMFDELAVGDFVDVFEQLRADQPWTVTKVDGRGDQAVLRLLDASGTAVEMSISLDSAGQINGLFFAPVSADRSPAADWDELEENVRALPASTSVSVVRVTDRVETILAIEADAVKPIGSIFKLYVLAAVVDALEDGSLRWDSKLTLTDDLRSLPSGKLQDEPVGTVVTVRDAAELMISISDNTATDMLMDAVGRDVVEGAQASLGHHDPALNTPFLTTREMFQLGWGERDSARGAWAGASVTERRSFLDQLPGGVLDIDPADLTESVWQLGLDWFANAADLREAHLGLQELAESEAGEPIREILALNPGAGMSIGDDWSYVAFKGGSSAGELAGSWYVERTDGERFTLSIQAASDEPSDLSDTRPFFGSIEDALSLLADY